MLNCLYNVANYSCHLQWKSLRLNILKIIQIYSNYWNISKVNQYSSSSAKSVKVITNINAYEYGSEQEDFNKKRKVNRLARSSLLSLHQSMKQNWTTMLYMLCLLCMHNAASDSLTVCTLIPYPVIMWHIYFRVLLILVLTIDMNSHHWGKWLNI